MIHERPVTIRATVNYIFAIIAPFMFLFVNRLKIISVSRLHDLAPFTRHNCERQAQGKRETEHTPELKEGKE